MSIDLKSKNQSINQSGKGGTRAGAGRKKGAVGIRTADAIIEAKKTGKTPLEVMLGIMNSTSDEKLQLTAAQAAAPYVHAKLSSVEVTGKDGGAIETISTVKLEAL